MADPLGQDQPGDDKKDVTLDFLGKPAPVAFKSQPALPSGGGAIGVGAGPATTAAGRGVGAVKRGAAFDQFLTDIAPVFGDAGGGPSGGADAAAGAASSGPSITGFDPGTFGAFLSAVSPGKFGMGMLGAPNTFAQTIGNYAMQGGRIASNMLGETNLTVNTPEGGKFAAVPGARVGTGLNSMINTALSVLGIPTNALTSALAITGTQADAQAITAALANPEATLTPDQLSMLAQAVITVAGINTGVSNTAPGQTSMHGAPGVLGQDAFGRVDEGNPNFSGPRGQGRADDAPGTPPGPPGPTGFQGDPTGQEGEGDGPGSGNGPGPGTGSGGNDG